MREINFTKMHGLGNDFIVVDNTDGSVQFENERIRALSNRHTGIGFDQLLIVQSPSVSNAEFDYRIFNADGEEVEHCGNGARCFARYVIDKGLTNNTEINVNTSSGLVTLLAHDDETVTVQMGVVEFEPALIPFLADEKSAFYDLTVGDKILKVGSASIGNPHVVIQVDDVQTANVELLGSLIESHERFPSRVNVGFMQVVDAGNIFLRVYERGVGETRACGTGACAAAAIGHIQGLLDKTVNVTLPGGDLKIVWPNLNSSIEMTGPCSTVFEGQTRM
jgi:diaminopimelate epimerase